MKKFLFYFVQWTWGLSVNLIGGICCLVFKYFKKCRVERYGYNWFTYVPGNFGGLSLGLFVFIRDTSKEKGKEQWLYNTQIHEYGHTFQCLMLGPLYWLVVAIPSFIWCNLFANYRKKNNVSYYKLYCESWANRLGEKHTGKKQNFDVEK